MSLAKIWETVEDRMPLKEGLARDNKNAGKAGKFQDIPIEDILQVMRQAKLPEKYVGLFWLHCYDRWHRYDPERCEVTGWLFMHARALRMRRKRPLYTQNFGFKDTDATVEQEGHAHWWDRVAAKLNEDEEKTLRMWVVEGCGTYEIAEKLGVSPQRLHQRLEAMRRKLGPYLKTHTLVFKG